MKSITNSLIHYLKLQCRVCMCMCVWKRETYVCVCVCEWGCLHIVMHGWRSEDSTRCQASPSTLSRWGLAVCFCVHLVFPVISSKSIGVSATIYILSFVLALGKSNSGPDAFIRSGLPSSPQILKSGFNHQFVSLLWVFNKIDCFPLWITINNFSCHPSSHLFSCHPFILLSLI